MAAMFRRAPTTLRPAALAHAKARPSSLTCRPLPRLQGPVFFPHRLFSATNTIMANSRTESDAFGEVQVQADRYWGAQTERSLENFKINQPQDRMPPPIVRAFGILKGAAATVNMKYGLGRPPPAPRPAANLIQRRPQAGQGHPTGCCRSGFAQAGRPLSSRRVANGIGHAVQHECQRGHLQPRH